MHSIVYGSRVIYYSLEENNRLKNHYITVERHAGVILKGKPLKREMADRLVQSKASWILNKLELVKPVSEGDIVTGSRIPYLGKKYYTEVKFNSKIEKPSIEFTHSKFIITVNPKGKIQEEIQESLAHFYKDKAVEKIAPRVEKLSKQSSLKYKSLRFIKMKKRWGSCTGNNVIVINPKAVQLSYSLIDYVILHELSHTKVKKHSKGFWKELSKHCKEWKKLNQEIELLKG